MKRGVIIGMTAAAAASAILPSSSAAQRTPGLWGYATATSIRERATLANELLASSGTTIGGEGGIAWQYLSLRAGYTQGTLAASDGRFEHDYVESHAAVGVRIVAGLELVGGLHGRAFVTTRGTQRWTFRQLRARYEAPIITPAVRGFAEFWRAAAGELESPGSRANDQDLLGIIRLRLGTTSIEHAFRSAGGGVAGIVFKPGRSPLAVRLSYAIDETQLGNENYRSTVEGITLAVGLDGVQRHW